MAWGWGNYWNQALEEQGWTKGLYPPTPEGGSEKVGIFVTPTRDGAQFTNCWAFAIHALSRHPDAAFELMETMLSPENLADYPDQGLPVRRSAWKQPGYQTQWYQVWQQAVESGRPMPETTDYNDLVDTVKTAVQEIILKDADPAETLKRYQDEFNQRHAD
jgi:ABC-type glycerol-3-phosphate transport system substrate-binding protein